jgi:hypothetical protein
MMVISPLVADVEGKLLSIVHAPLVCALILMPIKLVI